MKVNLAFNPKTWISHPLTEPDNFSFYQTIYICFLRPLNTPNSARVEALFPCLQAKSRGPDISPATSFSLPQSNHR
ncbi:MAG: hypothetical protein MUD09_08035, partial [Desulfobacterales bacterium]|nr:hypothetical protein [Desulfobacterales bacterium]